MSTPHAPIGVFDSGVGGLSILRALRAELPAEDFLYFADSAHAPYGERSEGYVVDRTQAVVRELIGVHRIKALVVACNTATAAAIHLVRAQYPQLPLVGVEPALKPAVALSRTGRIGVMATRGTLASAKFLALHESLKGQAEFVLQPCDGLADAIQHDDAAKIAALCARYTRALGNLGSENGQIDTLVLGCTHYPFAAHHLQPLTGPGVQLIETGVPVARQTRRLLEVAELARNEGAGSIAWLATGEDAVLSSVAARWLRL
ncbi:MAG: glutamate racemase [Ramlibacter sp.]